MHYKQNVILMAIYNDSLLELPLLIIKTTLQQKGVIARTPIARTFCPRYRSINSEDKSLPSLNMSRGENIGWYHIARTKVLAIGKLSSLYCSREIFPRTILAPNVRTMVSNVLAIYFIFSL